MRNRHFVLSILFTFFILFYSGDSFYIKIFTANQPIFAKEARSIKYQINPIPFVINRFFLPDISAEGIYITDLTSFTPLLEKNSQKRFLPASTTKIISALVAYENFRIDEILTVKRVINEGQTMGLIFGEKITAGDILYGLLVHSGNDAAYVLADNYPGGLNKFIEAMNKKAYAIGMRNSFFKNPAGLDDFGQYTTPYDLALAGRELLKNKQLAKIVSTKSITISDVDFKIFHELKNVNKLLGELPGIGGLKTGYTLDAGENLISFYKKNHHQFLIVILKSQDRFKDTKNLVDWINSNIDYINVL